MIWCLWRPFYRIRVTSMRTIYAMARNRDMGSERSRGPTIDDISEEIGRLYHDYSCHVALAMDLVSFGGQCRWLRVTVRRRGTWEPLGTAQFGTGVVGGARTYESAAYVALLRAREALQRAYDDDHAT